MMIDCIDVAREKKRMKVSFLVSFRIEEDEETVLHPFLREEREKSERKNEIALT